MKVEKVFGTIGGGQHWERTVLKTDANYTPYVICTGYNPETQNWASSYAYLRTKQELAEVLLGMIAEGAEFKGELIF